MSNTEIPKELEVAAQWWADHLGTREQDAGDVGLNLASQMFHCAPVATDSQKEAFKLFLIDRLYEDTQGRPDYWTSLGVDYGACQHLRDAMEEAGYPDTNGSLPIKTDMTIENGKVSVSLGYTAERKPIYVSKQRAKEDIARLEQDIKDIKEAADIGE